MLQPFGVRSKRPEPNVARDLHSQTRKPPPSSFSNMKEFVRPVYFKKTVRNSVKIIFDQMGKKGQNNHDEMKLVLLVDF